jgi:hypothetical protein
VGGASATIEHTLTRGTRPRLGTDEFGDGLIGSIAVMMPSGRTEPAELAVRDCSFEGSERAGIACFGASLRLGGSRLACNAIDLAAELYGGVASSFQDLGQNWCGCDADERVCQVASAGLEPPEPLEP